MRIGGASHCASGTNHVVRGLSARPPPSRCAAHQRYFFLWVEEEVIGGGGADRQQQVGHEPLTGPPARSCPRVGLVCTTAMEKRPSTKVGRRVQGARRRLKSHRMHGQAWKMSSASQTKAVDMRWGGAFLSSICGTCQVLTVSSVGLANRARARGSEAAGKGRELRRPRWPFRGRDPCSGPSYLGTAEAEEPPRRSKPQTQHHSPLPRPRRRLRAGAPPPVVLGDGRPRAAPGNPRSSTPPRDGFPHRAFRVLATAGWRPRHRRGRPR